ncbi:MAE_28990/MAE_18760 family HEPN-like nuclease [Pseudoclavibacter sp. 13-3]|uniref:MAE_28990/MAE_18760 family HEPN-like nuclease n=1 Tax=Pseudoclavibacter sp. 13-3 TaxID=2901228 RepID=UPI001E414082|nr:MAE_28990/MAE_18760 family HEPN-like nuclease [Pseudoclavibacter sp. 13-3]MCD7102389.1 hypothetical protein [Pseudoclavibacter sp. 13-3]
MPKIHTLEELDDFITDETVWRKRELTIAKRNIERTTDAAQKANLRSGLLFLYGHWEGWVKNVSKLYIRYVNTQAPKYTDLSTAFLGNAIKTKLSGVEEASKAKKHNLFASFIHDGLAKRAKLSEDLVQTDSNLSSTVFADIIERLGLPRQAKYASRSKLIDEELVDRRNTIAHGQFLEITSDDFSKLHSDVLELLELFTDDVRNAASQKDYLMH